ncbi:MAG: hypothetical protein WBW56_06620 [Syntrophobacteraceae bacterium]
MIRKHNKAKIDEGSALMLIPKCSLQIVNVLHQYIEMPFGDGHSEKICATRQTVAAVVGHFRSGM